MLNTDSVGLAAKAGVTLSEYTPNAGDQIFPCWIVCSAPTVDPSVDQSFWFNGGPSGVAIFPGTILAMFENQTEEFIFTGRDDGAGILQQLFGDGVVPVPAESGTKINYPPAPSN